MAVALAAVIAFTASLHSAPKPTIIRSNDSVTIIRAGEEGRRVTTTVTRGSVRTTSTPSGHNFYVDLSDISSRKVKGLKGYTSAEISGGVTVEWTPASSYGDIEVAGPSALIEHVKVEMVSNCLEIRFSMPGALRLVGGTVRVTLSAPVAQELTLGTAASLRITDDVRGLKKFAVQASSGASLRASDIAASELSLQGSSGATLTTSALSCTSTDISMSSGAQMRCSMVKASAEADISVSSGASLRASGPVTAPQVDVEVSSGANASFEAIAGNRTDMSSSSSATLKVAAVDAGNGSLDLSVGSSGSMQLTSATARTVEMEVSSVGECTVRRLTATSLDIDASNARISLGGTVKNTVIAASMNSVIRAGNLRTETASVQAQSRSEVEINAANLTTEE